MSSASNICCAYEARIWLTSPAPPQVGAGSTKVAERPFEKRDMWGNAIKDAAKTPMKVPKKDSWGNDIKEEGADRQQTVTAGVCAPSRISRMPSNPTRRHSRLIPQMRVVRY